MGTVCEFINIILAKVEILYFTHLYYFCIGFHSCIYYFILLTIAVYKFYVTVMFTFFLWNIILQQAINDIRTIVNCTKLCWILWGIAFHIECLVMPNINHEEASTENIWRKYSVLISITYFNELISF